MALGVVLAVGLLAPLALRQQSNVVPGDQPLALVFGSDEAGQLRYRNAVVAAWLVYAAAVRIARRATDPRAQWIVLAGTAALALTLMPTNPAGAQDIYHNIADARTLWVYGDNPAATPPSAHVEDPAFAALSAWQDEPSAYGPVWYALSGVTLPVTGSALWPNVIAQKALTSLFLLVTVYLVMRIVRQLEPGSEGVAGVLVGWNPLLLFETAGNAHNDIVMVTFGIAACYALVRGVHVAALPLLALAVAVKLVFAVLVPLVFIWMLRQPGIPRRTVALSLLLAGGVLLALYAPYLAEPETVETLRRQGARMTASLATALTSLLMEHVPRDLEDATATSRRFMLAVFVVGYGAIALHLWLRPSLAVLFASSAWVAFLALVTIAWWFWPWYVTWFVPLAALSPRRGVALVAVVFSLTAMLMYGTYYWNVYGDWHELQRRTAAVVFVAPMLFALVLGVWSAVQRGWSRKRTAGVSAGPGVMVGPPSGR